MEACGNDKPERKLSHSVPQLPTGTAEYLVIITAEGAR